MFHFPVEDQTVFTSVQINLHSKQKWIRVPLFHILTNACETSFLIIAHSDGKEYACSVGDPGLIPG